MLGVRSLLAIFLLVACVNCKGQYEQVLNKSYSDNYRELVHLFFSYEFWNKDSAAAYRQVNVFIEEARKAGDDKMVYEARFARIQYKIYNNLVDYKAGIDSFLNIEREVTAKEFSGKDVLLLRLQYLVSLQYYYKEELGKALAHQMKYYNTLIRTGADEYPLKKDYVAHIGCIYYSFEDYRLAKKHLEQAVELPETYPHVDIDIYNTLGLIMRNTTKYDSALYYFEKASKLASRHNDIVWQSVLNGNIGITYYYQHKYEDAIPLLKDDIRQGIESGQEENITNSIIKLADIYRIKQKQDSALYYCNMARKYARAGWNTHKHLVPLYRIMAKLALKDDDPLMAYKYADSANNAKDTLDKLRRVMLITRVQRAVDEERHDMDLAMLSAEKEAMIKKRNNLIIILVLISIIGLLLLNRQAIRRRRLLAEKELADGRLKSAQSRLDAFTKTLHEKNALLEASTEQIEKLQYELQEDADKQNQAIQQLQKSTILTEDEWDVFRELFEQVHEGFLYRLRIKVPDLTPAETRFMVLTKLKFNYKEMSAILGVSTGTLRSSKSRLIKKLQLTEDTDFENFVENI